MSTLQARNETTVNAPATRIWPLITDITMLHRINPGVIRATGVMNELNATRTCEIDNRGRKGTITERLIELVPKERTVWTVVTDTMGMNKMLKDIRFVLILQPVGNSDTRIIAETHYTPANFPARIMNALMMKKMIAKAQAQILQNITSLTANQ